MKLRYISFAVLIAVLLTPIIVGTTPALANGGYEINWWTIDDGGRYSAGDGFWLGGTIGQPDAGVHTGGGFDLSGGFWKIKESFPTAIDLLTLTAASNNKVMWYTLAASALLLVNLIAWRWHRKGPG